MTQFFKRYRLKLASAIFMGLAIASGCTYSHGVPAPCENATAALATYSGVVSPIFDQHCRTCHGATYNVQGDVNHYGGGIPFRNYQEIFNYSDHGYIMRCVKHDGGDNMPKIGDKLSDCDIARLQAWFDAGAPNN